MRRTNKKGFTIVELVIVIAVIAILAAVLIPTFASLVNKANRSADIQAVRQMNTQLAVDEVDSNKTIWDVYVALEEGGMTAKDYTPLSTDTYFYWIKELNRIVYVDAKDEVQFPEEYKGKKLNAVAGTTTTYLSLNGKMSVENVSKSDVISGTKATIDDVKELYWLAQGNNMTGVTEIEITVDTLDLHGANAAIVVSKQGSLTIKGKDGGTTITGLVATESKYGAEGKDYAVGFVAYVDQGANLEISNITVDGATVGGYEIGGVGGLIGRIEHTAGEVSVNNCKVINSTINGKNKVGALIGSIGSSKVTIDGDCLVENCTVNCSEGESGKAIGCVYNGLNLTVTKAFSGWVKKTTLNLIETDLRTTVDATNLTYKKANNDNLTPPEGCEKIVLAVKKGVSENKYRMFASDAYMTALNETSEMQVIIENTPLTTGQVSSLGGSKVTVNGADQSINILTFFK